MDLVKSLPEVFEDRFVGFGTYDVNRPDGATHWVLVSGKDLDDHLKFVNDLQTKHSKTFNKYIFQFILLCLKALRICVILLINFGLNSKSKSIN